MQNPKDHIKELVQVYISKYPEEHALVVKGVAMKRHMTRDEYASVENSEMRGLFEISERLQTMLIVGLSGENLAWFKSKEGGRWFARTFRDYALPTRI